MGNGKWDADKIERLRKFEEKLEWVEEELEAVIRYADEGELDPLSGRFTDTALPAQSYDRLLNVFEEIGMFMLENEE
jgi:hypothetical protein